MHYTHLFIFFSRFTFFAFFLKLFCRGIDALGFPWAHTLHESWVIALASSVVRSRGRQMGVQRGTSRRITSVLYPQLQVCKAAFLVKVSLQLSDDLVHFFILKPLQLNCCWPSSEDDLATLNASSEGQQFHNVSRTLLQFKREEKRFFLFTIKWSVLPGIYICTMDLSLKHKCNFLFLSFLLLQDWRVKLLQCFWACLNITCAMTHSKLQQLMLVAFKTYVNINSSSTHSSRRLFFARRLEE